MGWPGGLCFGLRWAEEKLRKRFRELCVRQHGSVVGAWKAMDLNADGRLTYFEPLKRQSHMLVGLAL